MADNNLVYELEGKIYINLTNRCTNACVFCIRNVKEDVLGKNLFLSSEDFSTQDVIEQLKKIYKNEPEIVFCGYGEPTLKLEILKEVAASIRKTYPQVKIRINTNGSANKVYKRDVTGELKGIIDSISVSLNGESAEVYDKLSNPTVASYEDIKDFIRKSAEKGFETTATIVTGFEDYKVDVAACEQIAKDLGAKLRVREWLPQGY